ncbi:hypothetical protein [Limnoglobus roseus]|uniref:Carboxypeptidase regulatory-like domain-containing protein n=1 Tax=Limnoglobus roseus TaxID=2598579 RepID=A0A5C1A9A3_9BACT|nr:hypothetical protein [Limnoglobus roseus]QEL15781.1 carboxypeptidase regulatory-like domain-containing protein [Limnoglobus roseus]
MTSNLPSRRTALLLTFAFGVSFFTAGCGGPPKADVKGKVTLDGKPIANGSIEFFPIGGKGQTAAAIIKDGEYTVQTSVCNMKVSVNANTVVGKHKAYDTPDSPMIEVVKNIIPAKYNTSSELTADMKAGPNEHNFDLKSDDPKK